MKLNAEHAPIFFTSDTHFGHNNIIKYCERPFTDFNVMEEEMIRRWNAKVPYNAIVFHLGDLSFYKDPLRTVGVIKRLNGTIYLVPGNHDEAKKLLVYKLHTNIVVLPQLQEVSIHKDGENRRFVMCHYPMAIWNKSHYGSMHLFGHSHGSFTVNEGTRAMDVGVDTSKDYTPFSLDEVLLHMYQIAFKAKDHHTGER